jgi:hypothetical protein
MWQKGAAAAVFAVLVILISAWTLDGAQEPQEPPDDDGAAVLVIDTSNAAQMHRYGLPTREDVMHYHVSSKWAYQRDGITVELDELPGGYATWYELYRLGKWSEEA